jgi:muconolactone delta-isomerase
VTRRVDPSLGDPQARAAHATRRWILVSLIAALIAMASAAPSRASENARFGIQDDAWLMYEPGTLDARIATLDDLGVRLVRLTLRWDQITPIRPLHERDPNDPAYDWGAFSTTLQQLHAHHIGALATIWGAPRWANKGHPPNWLPRSGLGNFAYAAARRQRRYVSERPRRSCVSLTTSQQNRRPVPFTDVRLPEESSRRHEPGKLAEGLVNVVVAAQCERGLAVVSERVESGYGETRTEVMPVKYLVTIKRRDGVPIPPEAIGDILGAQRGWLEDRVDEGVFDCAYVFAQGSGGIAIVNADSGEELSEILASSPAFVLVAIEVQPLAAVATLANAVEALQRVRERVA